MSLEELGFNHTCFSRYVRGRKNKFLLFKKDDLLTSMEGEIKGKGKKAIYRQRDFLIVTFITLSGTLGISGITPAFPAIVRELEITASEVGLLISVYSLPGLLSLPFLGILADRIGRKKVIIPSLLLFGVVGAACAFLRDFKLLLILRFFQGIGSAPLITLSFVMLCDIYSGRERTSAIFYNSSIVSLGSASFPAIGGLLASFGWYYPFLMPVLSIPLALATLSLKDIKTKNEQQVRKYLVNVWYSIKNIQAIGLFAVCIFIPIILFGTFLTYFPILLGDQFGASSFVIGLMISIMFVTTALTSSRLVKSARGLSEKTLIRVGFSLYLLSLLLIPLITDIYFLLLSVVTFGVAQGFTDPGRRMLMAKLAPVKHRSAFASLGDEVFILGESLGPVLMGLIFRLSGISGVFYAGSCFSVAIVILISLSIK